VIQSTDLRPGSLILSQCVLETNAKAMARASGERDFGVSSRRPILTDSAPQAHPQLRQQTAFRTEDVGISVFCRMQTGRSSTPTLLLTWRGHAEWGVSLSRSHTQGTRRSGSGLKIHRLGAPPRRIQGLNYFPKRVRPLTRATAPEAAQKSGGGMRCFSFAASYAEAIRRSGWLGKRPSEEHNPHGKLCGTGPVRRVPPGAPASRTRSNT